MITVYHKKNSCVIFTTLRSDKIYTVELVINMNLFIFVTIFQQTVFDPTHNLCKYTLNKT